MQLLSPEEIDTRVSNLKRKVNGAKTKYNKTTKSVASRSVQQLLRSKKQ